jgi:hypothetical protein
MKVTEMHKSVSDYPDSEVEPLQELKTHLSQHAEPYGLRSVRMVTNQRYDVPAIRMESRFRSVNTSAQNALDERSVDILSAFATQEGNQVYIVGFKPQSEDGDANEE